MRIGGNQEDGLLGMPGSGARGNADLASEVIGLHSNEIDIIVGTRRKVISNVSHE